MFVISFGGCIFFNLFLEEQSAVRLSEICFPFAWQVGETKPYGKNVSLYCMTFPFVSEVKEIDWRAKQKIRRRSTESVVCNRCIITGEIVVEGKAAAGIFVCHGMWTNHEPGFQYLFTFQIPQSSLTSVIGVIWRICCYLVHLHFSTLTYTSSMCI